MVTTPTEAPILEIADRVQHGHKLLDRFQALDKSNPDRAWEAIVELDGVLDRLRELRPARVFRSGT
jgi:hypothetical protein